MTTANWMRRVAGAALVSALAVGGYAVYRQLQADSAQLPTTNDTAPPVTLVGSERQTVELASDAPARRQITVSLVEPAPARTSLRLTGRLFIDPGRMVHVHARFPGEVIELGRPGNGMLDRPLRVGDPVQQGQTLAIMWCKEMGEKKSDLVDAISHLRFSERVLLRLKKLELGAVAQRQIEEAERNVEADRIALNRAERTLRSWRLSDEEIEAVKAEAAALQDSAANDAKTTVQVWAQAAVKVPINGVVLEQNIVPGDIVDTSIDLFKIADLSRLGVMANVYEEDLQLLETLTPDERRWTIQLKADRTQTSIEGRFEVLSNLVDPQQHTSSVVGWIDNPDGRLRVGQFITATIEFPAPAGVVTVPHQAVLEEGPNAYVFVEQAGEPGKYERRRVALQRLASGRAFVRGEPNDAERQAGARSLAVGERVVDSGCVELAGALTALRVQMPLTTADGGKQP